MGGKKRDPKKQGNPTHERSESRLREGENKEMILVFEFFDGLPPESIMPIKTKITILGDDCCGSRGHPQQSFVFPGKKPPVAAGQKASSASSSLAFRNNGSLLSLSSPSRLFSWPKGVPCHVREQATGCCSPHGRPRRPGSVQKIPAPARNWPSQRQTRTMERKRGAKTAGLVCTWYRTRGECWINTYMDIHRVRALHKQHHRVR
ncbi:hypothetical protein J3F83DRAFT_740410 [Trichoderma novae-zelandiae]